MKSPEKNYRKGYKQTLEHRVKMSAAVRGRTKSPEHRAKLSVSANRREKCWNWKGGRCQNGGGYIGILQPEHPNANQKGYVAEHRLIMEKKIGRRILPGEIVHHLNGIKTDNREENLFLMSRGKHSFELNIAPYKTKIRELEKEIDELKQEIEERASSHELEAGN